MAEIAPFSWPVHEEYTLDHRDGGWIYPVAPQRFRDSFPLTNLVLASELAKVNRPLPRRGAKARNNRPDLTEEKLRALMGFVRRFGLLGYTWMKGQPAAINMATPLEVITRTEEVQRTRLDVRVIRGKREERWVEETAVHEVSEPGDTFVDRHGAVITGREDIVLVDGDSYPWALDHALNVDRCLFLAYALEVDRRKTEHGRKQGGKSTERNGRQTPAEHTAVRNRLLDFLKALAATSREVPVLIPSATGYQQLTTDLSTYTTDLLETARRLLVDLVTPILRDVAIKIDSQTLEESIEFKSLLHCIYWSIANKANRARLEICRTCNTPFFAPHGHSKYCPAGTEELESRCGRRARQPQKH